MKKFNIHSKVKIKLTDIGKNTLRDRHFATTPDDVFMLPKEDKDGYSEWRLSDVIGIFGRHLDPLINEDPFDPNIMILDFSAPKCGIREKLKVPHSC